MFAITGAARGISVPQAPPGQRALPTAAALLGAPTAFLAVGCLTQHPNAHCLMSWSAMQSQWLEGRWINPKSHMVEKQTTKSSSQQLGPASGTMALLQRLPLRRKTSTAVKHRKRESKHQLETAGCGTRRAPGWCPTSTASPWGGKAQQHPTCHCSRWPGWHGIGTVRHGWLSCQAHSSSLSHAQGPPGPWVSHPHRHSTTNPIAPRHAPMLTAH